jgi:acetate---CoA ligase (ADP-forming)
MSDAMRSSGTVEVPAGDVDIQLRDGSTVRVRPVRADDAPAIHTFLAGLTADSIASRFFALPNLEWATRWSIDFEHDDRFALVAETGTPRRIVAHAGYVEAGPQRAEVAFVVADELQGRGVSTILLAHLAGVAAARGVATFTAEVLPANHRMIEVFRDCGFPIELRSEPGSITVEFPTSLSPEARTRFEDRDRLGAQAAVRHVLEPRSVAVIGASRRLGTVGGEVLRNLIGGGFTGPIYPVNPNAELVQSLPAYGSVADIPGEVDLAVIVVPADRVVAVARDCARAGVRALVVISSGFAEVGPQGAARQQELVEICRDAGMRLVGPNCLGVLNTGSATSLNATFAPHQATPGRVGFMSQSGGVGIAIIELTGRMGIGLSSFVSVGNKADLSGNDFLCFWEDDSATDVALLYLESFGNPRKFARIAPRFARRKPLLAVKSGRSAAGARATSSHTGALLAASDVTVDALFEQAGVIRADSLEELFSVAQLLSTQPIPRGDRIAIVTNAGGPGIMCADACQAAGVEVPELPAELRRELSSLLPAGASVGNPVDMIATASAGQYRETMNALIDADACDAIVAIFVPPLVTEALDVALAIRDVAARGTDVSLAAVFMTDRGAPEELSAGPIIVPGYSFPEAAARSLAAAARYGRWRARPEPQPVTLSGLNPERAAAVISAHLGAGGGWLGAADVTALLECYGLPLPPTRFAADVAEVVAAAEQLGGPVALKARAEGLIHKTDAGAVRLGLVGADEVSAAATAINAAVEQAGHRLQGFVVQPMAPPGVELIVGVVADPSFGPVLACGAGGTAAELLKDIAVRITPLSGLDAYEMLRTLRTFPLLAGYRGSQPCDIPAIENTILRVSAMVENHPEIIELDCNPLIATPTGAVIVDARVRIEPAAEKTPTPSLRA